MRNKKPIGVLEEELIDAVTANNNEDGEENVDDEKGPIEERKELIEDLFEKAEAYAKTNIEIIKLKAIEKIAMVIASLASQLVIIILFSFFFLMINIGLALWLGEVIGHIYHGFFIVAGLYAFLAILSYAFRSKIIKNPIINSIISQIINHEHHE